MYKIIIWGQNREYNKILSLLKMHEHYGKIKVVGVVCGLKNKYQKIDGYDIIGVNDVKSIDYDYCVWCQSEAEIPKAMKYISRDKIILSKVLFVPYFSFDKYIQLRENPVTIIAANCWAGFLYNYLGLEFSTPTINMWFKMNDFIRFVENLDYYLQEEIVQIGEGIDRFQNDFRYPISQVGDVTLYMNHYNSFEEGKDSWERRKKRINKSNIMVVASSDDQEIIERFTNLNIKNKKLFVPRDLGIIGKDLVPVDWAPSGDGRTLAMHSNGFANGSLTQIDVFDFIMGGNQYMRYE